MSFKLTAKQLEALKEVFSKNFLYMMLFGGSRSGKTFLIVRNIVMRALKAPSSRHCIVRFRFNHLKSAIIYDTFPKVMKIAFPDVVWTLNKTDWFVKFENGSEIWFGGLDDKQRTEKILGNEYATVYLNECSQISWPSVGIVITRLAQRVNQFIDGVESPLPMRAYFDCNPPTKAHWTYLVFILKKDPSTGEMLPKPEMYASFQINPDDNAENLAESYLETLDGLSSALRKRFREGNFADANPDAIFDQDDIEKWRVTDKEPPDFVRVLVSVDPSGADDTDNENNDEIGIVVAGLGVDGNAYVIEDCSVKAGPKVWSKVATSAFERHDSDCVIAETNYGGAMVKAVIQAARAQTPVKVVTATRGKAVRAEPFGALFSDGRVRFVGRHLKLESELEGFSTKGYVGSKSPNRADALIWALTELFPAITKKKNEVSKEPIAIPVSNFFRGR